MAIKLVIEASHAGSTHHELDQSLITFGRSKSCHIELDHAQVSRRHFIIKFIDSVYYIFDEGSRHGTMLDGHKLEPHKTYAIEHEHMIDVPGFSIKLFCDGQKPKLERTTVVARKLLDELLQDQVGPRECPSLLTNDGSYHFKFIEEEISFVLGRLPHVDFPVNDNSVAKEHVSFVRDFNGIRLNPLPGNEVSINGVTVCDPQILSHGARIKVGDIEFVYRVTADQEIPLSPPPSHEEEILPAKTAVKAQTLPNIESHVNKMPDHSVAHNLKQPLVTILDRFFLLAFVLALAGASAMFFVLI